MQIVTLLSRSTEINNTEQISDAKNRNYNAAITMLQMSIGELQEFCTANFCNPIKPIALGYYIHIKRQHSTGFIVHLNHAIFSFDGSNTESCF